MQNRPSSYSVAEKKQFKETCQSLLAKARRRKRSIQKSIIKKFDSIDAWKKKCADFGLNLKIREDAKKRFYFLLTDPEDRSFRLGGATCKTEMSSVEISQDASRKRKKSKMAEEEWLADNSEQMTASKKRKTDTALNDLDHREQTPQKKWEFIIEDGMQSDVESDSEDDEFDSSEEKWIFLMEDGKQSGVESDSEDDESDSSIEKWESLMADDGQAGVESDREDDESAVIEQLNREQLQKKEKFKKSMQDLIYAARIKTLSLKDAIIIKFGSIDKWQKKCADHGLELVIFPHKKYLSYFLTDPKDAMFVLGDRRRQKKKEKEKTTSRNSRQLNKFTMVTPSVAVGTVDNIIDITGGNNPVRETMSSGQMVTPVLQPQIVARVVPSFLPEDADIVQKVFPSSSSSTTTTTLITPTTVAENIASTATAVTATHAAFEDQYPVQGFYPQHNENNATPLNEQGERQDTMLLDFNLTAQDFIDDFNNDDDGFIDFNFLTENNASSAFIAQTESTVSSNPATLFFNAQHTEQMDNSNTHTTHNNMQTDDDPYFQFFD